MRERTLIALTISGLSALGLYRYRRRLLSRLLGLPTPYYEVAVERGLRVPMPDGAELVADRYHPRAPNRFPTILVRTPYGRTNLDRPLVMRLFAERGYNAVIQDVRGRFDSGGEFGFLVGEDVDGRATMDWISEQPWFDGLLGLWGESYLGYAQWAAVPEAPSYLKAVMPGISASRFHSVIYPDGAFGLDVALPVSVLLENQEADSNGWFARSVLVPLRIRRGFLRLPVGESDLEAARRPLVRFREWLSHPEPDASYWHKRDQSSRVSEVGAGVHLFGGWYDIFLRQLLGDYAALVDAGKNPYLTVGPYPHGSVRMFIDLQRETFAWFGLRLKGEADKAREKPVRLELYARSSLEHTDFFGRLCDVHPSGKSVNVCDGLFRLELGKGERRPDGVFRIEIDMWATAYRFRRGHRVRLQVSSGAHPRWNRNLGTGEPIATATAMRAADQAVYHDRGHPSTLVLPVTDSGTL